MKRSARISKRRTVPPIAAASSHAAEAQALAGKLKRVFPRRTDWKVCAHPGTPLDALAVKRFHDTCWDEIPDWVAIAHRETIPNLTDEALLALAPAFLRPALADWRPENELVEAVVSELCNSQRLDPHGFVAPLSQGERRYFVDFLTLVARTPAFENLCASVLEGVRAWKLLAAHKPTVFLGEDPKHTTLRRRDFTRIAGANNGSLEVLVQDMALDSESLADAALSKIRLPKAYLPRVNLRNADLTGANLRGANLEWADLSDAVLDGADLRGAILSYCRLGGASIENARLEGACAPYAVFDHATLRGSILDDANLEAARFVGVDVDGARFNGASMLRAYVDALGERKPSFDGADLRGSTISPDFIDEDEVQPALVDFPDLRAAPFELIGKPFEELRWALARPSEEVGPTTQAHGTYTVILRPDYALHFYTRANARVCGFRIDHPSQRSADDVLLWVGCKDLKKLERAYTVSRSPGITLVHARGCNHRSPPVLRCSDGVVG